MGDNIQILIADDHPIVRQGLRDLLVPRNGMRVVGEAKDGREAVQLAAQLKPDVVLMDMIMPEMNGAEATAAIKKLNPRARILILTSFGEEAILVQTMNAGAQGYLLKDSQPENLLQAIRSVYQGQLVIPQQFALTLLKGPSEDDAQQQALTEREREVLVAVSEGLANKDIAQRLGISTNTVRTHISHLLAKLNLANRTQLAIYAREHSP